MIDLLEAKGTDTKGERTNMVRQYVLSEVVHDFNSTSSRGGNNSHRDRGNWERGHRWMLDADGEGN